MLVVPFALMILGLQAQPDTVALSVTRAYEEAMAASPEVVVERQRARGAVNQAQQDAAFPNPVLSFAAENLGSVEEITGLESPEGIEGQLFLSTSLPFGPTRHGQVGAARARGEVAEARTRLVEHAAAEQVLTVMSDLLRTQSLESHAREELATLDRLAEALALQAEEGRAAGADAARALMARGLASTALARKEMGVAEANAVAVRWLGRDPEAWILLQAPQCEGDPVAPSPAAERTPEVEVAAAQLAAARAETSIARGVAVPDLQPQVGLRRGGGVSALYVGFTTTLPLFDQGSRGVAAAQHGEEAADAELTGVEARLAAERIAARRGLDALERAGSAFDADWFAALEEAVVAAELRFDLGEGTLYELLDQRRARLQALDDYATWQAEWWRARARLHRLQGRRPDADLVCTDPFREND